MLSVLLMFIPLVQSVIQNQSCPNVIPEEIDLRSLNGAWYVSEAATDIPIGVNCSRIIFNHKGDSTTEVSVHWTSNKTLTHYNGTAAVITNGNGDNLRVNFSDNKFINYTVMAASYDHYALLYSCENVGANSSTYELWKLSRAPSLKKSYRTEMDNVLAKSNITTGQLKIYYNTKQCSTNTGTQLPNSITMAILGSVIMIIVKQT